MLVHKTERAVSTRTTDIISVSLRLLTRFRRRKPPYELQAITFLASSYKTAAYG